MSRRIAGTIACVLLCATCATAKDARAAGRVLIVCDERVQMEALAKYLREKGGCEVEVVDQEQFPADTGDLTAIINFVHKPHTERVEKALIAFAENGGRLISLHHAISSSKNRNKNWLPFCGIALLNRSLGRDKGGWHVLGGMTVELVNLRPDHYITRHEVHYSTVTAYTPSDSPSIEQRLPAIRFSRSEMFLNQHFTDARKKTVLFGMKATDPKTGETFMQDRGGWVQRKGRGWHFYLQAGHATGDFQNEAYCRILLNCLTWRPPD